MDNTDVIQRTAQETEADYNKGCKQTASEGASNTDHGSNDQGVLRPSSRLDRPARRRVTSGGSGEQPINTVGKRGDLNGTPFAMTKLPVLIGPPSVDLAVGSHCDGMCRACCSGEHAGFTEARLDALRKTAEVAFAATHPKLAVLVGA